MPLRSHASPVASAIGLILVAGAACTPRVPPAVAAITAVTSPSADSVGVPELPKRTAGEDAATYLRRAEAAGFSGEVLAAIGDSIVLHAAYGTAIAATHTQYDTTTPTYIGSLTKQFTAAAILKLAEDGRLSVHDSIGKFIRGVPIDKAGVTIEQILTHTAGIPDTIGERYGNEFLSRDEFVRRVLAAPLDPVPRAFSYSSSGYALLGVLVELASGQRYEDYLRQHLFRPAGLTRTGYTLAPPLMQRAAHARRGSQDLGAPQSRKTWTADGPTWALRGGGGMLSTAGDLFRWYRALRNGTVLSSPYAAQLFEPHVAEDSTRTSFYGYGWFVVPETSHGKAIGHNGSDGVYYGTLVNFADHDVVVIVLTNAQPSGFRRIEAGVTAAVFDGMAKH
jgi:CubicO group peptidase (beta-lactamase class C family)